MRTTKLAIISITFLAAIVTAGAAPEINGKIAIKGYDPVAYFVSGGPQKGNPSYSFQWKGAEWRFASSGNRDKFAAEPTKYAPQYGGYCAWAVSRGYTAKIDPSAWKIVDGKLYLNYSQRIRRKWFQDIPGNIQKANANWPKVLN